MSEGQVTKEARARLGAIAYNKPTKVQIAGTKRFVKIKNIHPYTIERLTRLWLEREDAQIEDTAAGTLKSMCKDPYFAIKEAVICVLNSWWKIILIYPIKWRIWAFLREYTEEQMTPIIMESKKKLPLMPHWTNMAFSVDMRNDWKKMTEKEAEQYQAELLSAMKQVSSKISQPTEGRNGGSGISPTDAN